MKNTIYALILFYVSLCSLCANEEATFSQQAVKVPRLALGGLSHVRQRSKSDSQVSSVPVPVHIVISPRKKGAVSRSRKYEKTEQKKEEAVSQNTYIDLIAYKDRESLLAYQRTMLSELEKLKAKKEHWEWHVTDADKELKSLEMRGHAEYSVKHNSHASREQKDKAKAFLHNLHDLAQGELKRKAMFLGFLKHEQIEQKIIDKETILKQLEIFLKKSSDEEA